MGNHFLGKYDILEVCDFIEWFVLCLRRKKMIFYHWKNYNNRLIREYTERSKDYTIMHSVFDYIDLRLLLLVNVVVESCFIFSFIHK